jgi:hypothetical protein
MQVEPKNNYNVLGRLGPVQPKPEYRPRSSPEGQTTQAGGEASSRTSEKPSQGSRAQERAQERAERTKAAASASTERLSLPAAKNLTEATAEAITALDPGARKGPHSHLASDAGLMYPRYV